MALNLPTEAHIGPSPADIPSSRGRGATALGMRVATAYVAALRRRHPRATPAQLSHVIEKQFLMAMALGGTGTGLLALRGRRAATLVGLSAAHLGSAGVLSSVYLFALAHIHGLDPSSTADLVRTCALGEGKGGILEQQFQGTWWKSALAYLPASQVRFVNNIASRSLAKAARKGGVSASATALPGSIGATVGFTGGRTLGNRVVDAAAERLGPAPRSFLF